MNWMSDGFRLFLLLFFIILCLIYFFVVFFIIILFSLICILSFLFFIIFIILIFFTRILIILDLFFGFFFLVLFCLSTSSPWRLFIIIILHLEDHLLLLNLLDASHLLSKWQWLFTLPRCYLIVRRCSSHLFFGLCDSFLPRIVSLFGSLLLLADLRSEWWITVLLEHLWEAGYELFENRVITFFSTSLRILTLATAWASTRILSWNGRALIETGEARVFILDVVFKVVIAIVFFLLRWRWIWMALLFLLDLACVGLWWNSNLLSRILWRSLRLLLLGSHTTKNSLSQLFQIFHV